MLGSQVVRLRFHVKDDVLLGYGKHSARGGGPWPTSVEKLQKAIIPLQNQIQVKKRFKLQTVQRVPHQNTIHRDICNTVEQISKCQVEDKHCGVPDMTYHKHLKIVVFLT